MWEAPQRADRLRIAQQVGALRRLPFTFPHPQRASIYTLFTTPRLHFWQRRGKLAP